MAPQDLLDEAVAGISARPARSALTVLGTVLGITTLVITLGIAETAANQIAGGFDAVTATEITVMLPRQADPDAPPLVDWQSTAEVARRTG